MNTLLKITTAAATVALMSAGAASAKAHNQGDTDAPGENVGTETVDSAKTLGAALGNGKKPVAENGKSSSAGKKKIVEDDE